MQPLRPTGFSELSGSGLSVLFRSFQLGNARCTGNVIRNSIVKDHNVSVFIYLFCQGGAELPTEIILHFYLQLSVCQTLGWDLKHVIFSSHFHSLESKLQLPVEMA